MAADRASEILATGALMPAGSGAIEPTRLRVREEARGTGAGKFLLAALVDQARKLGATALSLTNARCHPAINL